MQTNYLTFLDILPAIFWFIVILVAALVIRGNKRDLPHYKYYIPNLLMKMFFGVAFGVFYIYLSGGGDTTAFYDTAICLNNLFFKSPELYFQQLFLPADPYLFTTYFDSTTGYPPGWIYREPEGFFVAKIISILSFFTLNSYFAMTFLVATFTAHASWKMYLLVRAYDFSNQKLLVIGILFLPSVNFWCSGVSKDTVVFVATMYLIYNAFKLISKEHRGTIFNLIGVVVTAFIIYHIRSFVLTAILIPLFFGISARLVRILGGGNMTVIMFRTLVLVIGLVSIGQSFILQSEQDFIESNSVLKEAAVIQNDFKHNDIYGDKKYDLGEIEFTSLGLLKVMPLATVTGIFRPFFWEALSPALILNGIESIVFLVFTFLFFRRNALKKWALIRGHEFLIFCLLFLLIIGFMTGMTSILYGVLVRLRAPLLPFLFVLLTLNDSRIVNEESAEAQEI